jgi:hypothetical protein
MYSNGSKVLACKVKVSDCVPLGLDKIKARECRVLYEVNEEGVRI